MLETGGGFAELALRIQRHSHLVPCQPILWIGSCDLLIFSCRFFPLLRFHRGLGRGMVLRTSRARDSQQEDRKEDVAHSSVAPGRDRRGRTERESREEAPADQTLETGRPTPTSVQSSILPFGMQEQRKGEMKRDVATTPAQSDSEIGRASCRERE